MANTDGPLVRLRLITHNARLADSRKEKGFILPDFAEAIGMPVSRLRLIEGLRRLPTEEEICKITVLLEKPTDYLFPENLLRAVDVGVFAKRKVELETPQLENLIELTQPMLLTDGGINEVEQKVDTEIAHDNIEKALKTLTSKEARVLQFRYGLDGCGERTLEDVARLFHLTRERIRQIEHKALTRLRHPTRRHILEGYTKSKRDKQRHKANQDKGVGYSASVLMILKRANRNRIRNPILYQQVITPPNDSPQPTICEICGQYTRQKGEHVLSSHPEYRIYATKAQVRKWGTSVWARPHEYTVYHCGWCQYHHSTIGYLIKHIRESHQDRIAQKGYIEK